MGMEIDAEKEKRERKKAAVEFCVERETRLNNHKTNARMAKSFVAANIPPSKPTLTHPNIYTHHHFHFQHRTLCEPLNCCVVTIRIQATAIRC